MTFVLIWELQSSLAMIKGEQALRDTTSFQNNAMAYDYLICSVMSGIITGPYFLAYFNQPARSQIGTMVAVLEVGAFGTFDLTFCAAKIFMTRNAVTSLLAGRLGDALGRRRTLFLGATIFVIGGAVQTATTGYGVMVIGRLISGAGVGLLS